MTPRPTELIIRLRDVFAEYFNEEELQDFTFALGIDYENIEGKTKSGKARELAEYIWRYGMLPKLAIIGPQERPDIDWAGILNAYVPNLEPPAAQNAAKPDHRDLQKLIPILADYPMFQTPDGRRTVLTLAGVQPLVNVDLNGSPRLVASNLIVQLNDYGLTAEGDNALGRLLRFIAVDPALPPAQRDVINDILSKYNIA